MDRLAVQVKLDVSKAKSDLKSFITMLRQAEGATTNFKKVTSASGDASKKAGSEIVNASDKAKKSLTGLEKSAKNTENALSRVGKKASVAFGKTLVGNISGAIGMLRSMASTALMVGSALSGITMGKVASDYIQFSKGAGQVNAIVGGGAGTQKLLENSLLRATAGSGQSAMSVMEAAQRLTSTMQFDPTRGAGGARYAVGSKEYNDNIRELGDLLRSTGEFASATNTDINTMTDGLVKFAGVYGKDLSDPSQLNDVRDTFTALLNTSQGGLERLIPQIAKFGQEFKNIGVSQDEALGIFSVLTNVFDPEEAGTRTLAIAKWAQNSVMDIQKIGSKVDQQYGTNYSSKMYDALYYKDEAGVVQGRSIQEKIKNVMKMVSSETNQDVRDMLSSSIFGEIREASGTKTFFSQFETYSKTMDEFNNKAGLAGRAVESYYQASGAKIDLFFKSLETSGLAVAGALVDIFSGNKLFNINEFEDVLEDVGAKLNYRLGEGASKPIRMMIEAIKWLDSSAGRDFMDRVGKAVDKLWGVIKAITSFTLDVLLSPPVQSIMDFIMANPAVAITVGLLGVSALQTAIQLAVSSAIASGLVGKLGLALGALTLGYIAADAINTNSINEQIRTENNVKLAEERINKEGLTKSNLIDLGIAQIEQKRAKETDLTASDFTSFNLKKIKDASVYHLDRQAANLWGVISKPLFNLGISGASQNVLPGGAIAKPIIDMGANSLVNNVLPKQWFQPYKSGYDREISYLNSLRSSGSNDAIAKMFNMESSKVQNAVSQQDQKVGEGAAKLSEGATGIISASEMMKDAVAGLNRAADSIRNINVNVNANGVASVTTGGGPNKSTASQQEKNGFWSLIPSFN